MNRVKEVKLKQIGQKHMILGLQKVNNCKDVQTGQMTLFRLEVDQIQNNQQ